VPDGDFQPARKPPGMAEIRACGHALARRPREIAFSIRNASVCPSPGIGFKTAFYSTN
jgi:hypothetical protein